VAVAALALMFSSSVRADPVDRWSSQIAEASDRFEIPAEWIRRVIQIESGGRTLLAGNPVVSSAGAMGLMQLMPATWRDMRALLGLGADPFDPRDNILAGTAYLRLMYDRFGYPGLFAAYNAGPARYAEHLASGGRLPAETRAYVARAAGIGRSAAATVPRSTRQSPAPLFAVAPGATVPASARATAANMFGSLFVDLRGGAGR
jgi:soluble lytic murein transglycosylase-like protein